MQPLELISQIPLPSQSIKKLSFCSSSKSSRLAEWASLLRPTQVTQTGALLYRALPELNQLITPAITRFEMLECLRPYIQNVISGLSKGFLQQPIALPESAQKSAVLAQALQKHMIDGYMICVRDALTQKRKKADAEEVLPAAIHRAITGISLLFMRSFQIYTQPTRNMWLGLHSLFQIADHFELLDRRITDNEQSQNKVTSIQTAYLRTVLLSSARPHQLNQNDINAMFNAFGVWAELLRFKIDLSDDPDCFYYVNLCRDLGPHYKSRRGDDESGDLLIELNFKPLLNQLTKQSGDALEELGSSASLKVPKDISPGALEHLLDTWGNIAQRRQERRDIQSAADVCVGLRDCHYYICNGQDFDTFVNSAGGEKSDIQNTTKQGFTPRDSFSASPSDIARPSNKVEIQNVSQGGYCLIWPASMPLKVQAGDVVAIKEFDKRVWSVGAVRWIRQRKQQSQLGVQILSDKAKPYGIAQVYDMGGYSDYMHAIFLPSPQFSEAPATLITPSAPFKVQDKVKILDGDQTYTAKLDEKVFATSNFQQFIFHNMDVGQPSQKTNNSMPPSNWD